MGKPLSKNDPIFVGTRQIATPDIIQNEDKTHRFLTTRRYPIYYMPITKCASTFMKNLMFALDHDRLHGRADYIHDHPQDLMRADKTPRWMLRRSRIAFSVVRNPVNRFLSLYFDKIYGTGAQNFPELRLEIAQDCNLDLSSDLPVQAHRENCDKLIGWIAKNLAHDTEAIINPHWRPQSVRLNAVSHIKLGFLTTDGLEEQLVNYLGGMIPDLRDKIALTTARNKTPYPVDVTELVDDDLRAAVTEVYPDDMLKYRQVRRYWKRRLANQSPPVISADPKLNVLTTHRFNLNMVAQQKAGSTYLRNLFYALDHGRVHPDPGQIAKDECLVYRAKTAAEIATGINIIVLRDPFQRFFSLYFDKVWGEGQQNFPWIAKMLDANRRFRTKRELSQAEHHDNCCRFLGYLETRFKERPVEELNPHWRPQHVKIDRARAFGFTPILLDEFADQFVHVAGDRIRGAQDAIALDIPRNETEKPISARELVSPWITERLHALYSEDIALYHRIKTGWAETGEPPEL